MRKIEEYVMDELDEFFEEGKRRDKQLKLLIDDLSGKKNFSYTSSKLELGMPIKNKFIKRAKVSKAKDKNNKKDNLF